MASSVRPADLGDVAALMSIRSALTPRWHEAFVPAAGGFLLGSSDDAYRALVSNGCVMLAETAGKVTAFSVVLPDSVLRSSEVYGKRHDAGIAPESVARLEGARVAYFDQLAAVPGHGPAATMLAYLHLLDTCKTHDAVLATTVIEPVVNRAAVPLLEAVGFRAVGSIAEHYPDVGPIMSRVHLVESGAVAAAAASTRGMRFQRWAAASRRGDLSRLAPVSVGKVLEPLRHEENLLGEMLDPAR